MNIYKWLDITVKQLTMSSSACLLAKKPTAFSSLWAAYN